MKVILAAAILLAASGLSAQNATSPAAGGLGAQAQQPKYRSHFVVYDVEKKTVSTIFTVDGEFHAPNWTPRRKVHRLRHGRRSLSHRGGRATRRASRRRSQQA